MAQRYALIDGIRGLAIVNMILYHAIWDLVYLYGFDWQWYLGPVGTLWQQAICWTFILVSGFCLPLSSHPVQRGVEVSLAGLAVTMVTLAVMPAARIVFGVLTCIGAAMILCGLAQPLFARLAQHAAVAGSVCFLLFLVTKHVPDGYIGIAGWTLAELPSAWYADLVTTFFGLPAADFSAPIISRCFRGSFSLPLAFFSTICWLRATLCAFSCAGTVVCSNGLGGVPSGSICCTSQ